MSMIFLSETWLWLCADYNLELFKITGFPKPFVLRRNRRGVGVLCWVANNIAARRKHEFEVKDLELLWLKISFFCALYRPPSSSYDFWENLQTSINI